MNKRIKNVVAGIFVVSLTIFLIVMELSLRIVGNFSPKANRYILDLLQSHPIIFGSLWITVMVAALSIAYVKYSEQKTNGKLAAFLFWMAIFVGILLYGIYLVL